MEDIAREAGTGKGTLYLHFKNKEELAFSILDRETAKVHAKLESIARSSDCPVNRVKAMLFVRVMERFDSAQKYAQSLDDLLSTLRVELLQRRAQYIEKEARIIAIAIEDGIKDGSIECQDSYRTAQLLLMATSSLLPHNLSPKELGGREDILSKTIQIVDLMFLGLLSECQRKNYQSNSSPEMMLSYNPMQNDTKS
jgi:AcrR family transcriptional regulator